VFLPGCANDVRGLKALPLNLPEGSEVYGDSAYTDYTNEDDLKDSSQIQLQVMRKKNSTRPDPPWTSYVKQHTRHYIETVFSGITRVFPKSIHAVTFDGFLLKLSAFIFAFTLKTAFIDQSGYGNHHLLSTYNLQLQPDASDFGLDCCAFYLN
jgi:hypothetical protein